MTFQMRNIQNPLKIYFYRRGFQLKTLFYKFSQTMIRIII